jgi:hypothetical protein
MSKLPVVLICRRQHALRHTPDTSHIDAVPPPHEGRFAIVTNVGSGMRWTRQHQLTSDVAGVRRSRVVLTPRRWCQGGGGDVGPNGPDTPLSAGDGDKKARSPGRVRRKPLKPLRRKRRVNPVKPVVTALVCSLHFAREAAGAASSRRFLHPLFSEGSCHAYLGRTASRERLVISRRHCEEQRDEAIPTFPSFRGDANGSAKRGPMTSSASSPESRDSPMCNCTS